VTRRRFTFIPADVLCDYGGPYRGQALAMWQWFVQRLAESGIGRGRHSTPYEWINGTSSINNHEPNPIGGEEFWKEPRRRVVDLLLHTGRDDGPGRFLRKHCGIPSWASLTKPIIVPIQTSDEFPTAEFLGPSWFTMGGRTFKKSPNSCHSEATWVQDAELELNDIATLWRLKVEYGYPHDSSSWYWRVAQEKGERLDAFAARVNQRIEEAMTPDTNPGVRREKVREWGRTYEALRGVFYEPTYRFCGWEDSLSDEINRIDGSSLMDSRITLTGRRIATLKKWAKETAKKSEVHA
jgi:hypothetical protein